MTATTEEPGEWVADRRGGRLVPRHISDLFTRCIRDHYADRSARPTSRELRDLSDWYGLPPLSMLGLVARLADDRALIDDARQRTEVTA